MWEYGELLGEFMDWNTGERAIREKKTQEQSKRSGQARLVYVKDIREHRILGVTLDEELKRQSHIDSVCKKLTRNLFFAWPA